GPERDAEVHPQEGRPRRHPRRAHRSPQAGIRGPRVRVALRSARRDRAPRDRRVLRADGHLRPPGSAPPRRRARGAAGVDRPQLRALAQALHRARVDRDRGMRQVLVRGGGVVVEDVPAPTASARAVLVRVAYSCVSVGTELTSVRLSGMPLYRRALKQPEHVKRVLAVAKDQGLLRTVQRVRGQLASGLPTGYAAAGTIVELGDEVAGFAVGDEVACAGAGIANHAEYINVPVNLAARVPAGVPLEHASTA